LQHLLIMDGEVQRNHLQNYTITYPIQIPHWGTNQSIHNTKFHAELFCPLLEMRQTATSFKICLMFDFSAYLSQDIMQIVFTLAF